jgi:pimeloyl-ACP methyl ester carboxylesterase
MELRMWVDGPHRSADQVDPTVRQRVSEMNRRLLDAPDEGTPIPLNPPAVDQLGDVRAPTLVLFGDQDQPDVVAGSEGIAREVPGARSALIPNAAHMVNMEQPETFNRLVLDFLNACA